jgi:hypothetical protein
MSAPLRALSMVLVAGNVIGLLMYRADHDWSNWIQPIFLFFLASTPSGFAYRMWPLVIAGTGAAVYSCFENGLPLLRPYTALDVELLFALQILLIAYFLTGAVPWAKLLAKVSRTPPE